jgi:predicted amidophosphoribosyltransferase
VLCAPCRAELCPAPELACPEGLERLWALLAYEGAGRRVVTAIKYRRGRGVVPGLARALAARLDGEPVDVVTWLPTTASRRRTRGFDQARLLAREVARAVGVPVAPLLQRRPGPAQTGRSAADRRRGPELVARSLGRGRILVVDDVVTTGASMTAAGRAARPGWPVRPWPAHPRGARRSSTPVSWGTRVRSDLKLAEPPAENKRQRVDAEGTRMTSLERQA